MIRDTLARAMFDRQAEAYAAPGLTELAWADPDIRAFWEAEADHVLGVIAIAALGTHPAYVDVVLSRGPGPDGDFVELEDPDGRGLGPNSGAAWVDRGDGFAVLRIPVHPSPDNEPEST